MFYYLFVLIIYPLISFQKIRLNNINYKIMKSVATNESISFESTFGSPSKPNPNDIVQKPKQIFLVNYVPDNISLNQTIKTSSTISKKKSTNPKSPKSKKNKAQKINPIKNNKNIKFHMLDFDALYKSIIIGEKKILRKSSPKKIFITLNKTKKNLIGFKRIRLVSNKSSSFKSKNIIIIHNKFIVFNIFYFYRNKYKEKKNK